MRNVLSVDLESWATTREQDAGFMPRAIDRLLELFDRYQVKTTFFVVGSIYDWYPEAVEKLAVAGHELGWHTHIHRTIPDQATLAGDLKSSQVFLEKFHPRVFRAPQMRIRREYFPLLKSAGFAIDSSLYAPWGFAQEVDGIFEAPVSSLAWWGHPRPLSFPREMSPRLLLQEIPFGSSYFMGILGKQVSWLIRAVNLRRQPAMLFVHPWQLYDCPPAPHLTPNRFSDLLMKPYHRKILPVVESLLDKFEFVTLSDVVHENSPRQ